MSAWAKPGVKCVCVDNAFYGHGSRIDAGKLVVGSVYTIASVVSDKSGRPAIRLVGLENESLGYLPSRFRPLVAKTQEQDVALFAHLLDGLPVGAEA